LGRVTEAVEQRLLLGMLGPLSGAHVLDVGCGDGVLLQAMVANGAIVTGVDPDPDMLAAARARVAGAHPQATLLEARAQQLPFPDASFDVVCAVTVLCFIADPAAALQEMVRVLRPGGRLVLGELGRWNLWATIRRIEGWAGSATWSAARLRSASELRTLLGRAGLKVIDVRGAVFFPPIGTLAQLMERVDPWLGRLTIVGAAFIAIRGNRLERAQ
jgi:ubiquinone/menaquinone biosynthesis C-methylase UbiE